MAPKKDEPEAAPAGMDPEWIAGKDTSRGSSKLTTTMTPDDASITMVIEGGLLSTSGATGLSMLLSGARGTTGVTSGRYFYEVRIMDLKRDGRVRLGFGTAEANIIVGADGNSWAMDAEGATWHEATKTPPGTVKTWTYDDVIGIFVNLDKTTVNCGTFSVFKMVNASRILCRSRRR
jgi:hypothetical protein